MGALTVQLSATGGDLFGGFTATYSADLADGLAVEAVLGTGRRRDHFGRNHHPVILI